MSASLDYTLFESFMNSFLPLEAAVFEAAGFVLGNKYQAPTSEFDQIYKFHQSTDDNYCGSTSLFGQSLVYSSVVE